ncbi:MAG: translation initiation factor [Clostridiales bacterium]|nr:translation initiation factor [Clostridiales bacterium]
MKNDLAEAMLQFLSENPDLPTGEPAVEPGEQSSTNQRKPDKLNISIERKGRGGKSVTIIAGFNDTTTDEEIATLARDIKTKLGVGGSSRGGEILIQGERRREVTEFLKSRGYRL